MGDYSGPRLVADLTRVGYLPRTWLPPQAVRELRQLVNYRRQLMDERRARKLRVGALLREYRAKPPQNVNRWTKAWVAFARTPDRLAGTARWIVGRHLDQIADLDTQVAQAEKRLRAATEHDPLVARLLEPEGIGE